jgi:hypothetical protein
VEFITYGVVSIEGESIDTVRDLVEVLNEATPEQQITPSAVTRLKKRLQREKGGYVLRDGRLARGDGTIIQPVDPIPALEAIAHMGIEFLLNNPWKIRTDDIIKALELLGKYRKETEETDEFGQAWGNFYQKNKRRKRVINVTPEAAADELEPDV